jgi:membrane-associated phospholipid phosphatase
LYSVKAYGKEERPDQSNNLSFPSGHTAIAFASAQFMFREYKDTNFWLEFLDIHLLFLLEFIEC